MPDNFVKRDENFYHSYHVTALYELSLTTPFADQRKVITDYAARWLGYVADQPSGKRVFVDPVSFVKKIERFRIIPHQSQFRRAAAQGGSAGHMTDPSVLPTSGRFHINPALVPFALDEQTLLVHPHAQRTGGQQLAQSIDAGVRRGSCFTASPPCRTRRNGAT